MYIDAHTHFNLILDNGDITEEDLLNNLHTNSIKHTVQIAIDLPSITWSRNFAKKHKDKGIFFSMGIHPSSKAEKKDLDVFTKHFKDVNNSDDKALLFGIGECGLDYFRMRQSKEMQMESFEYQISTAKDHNIPLIVHSRDATEDTIKTLQKNLPSTVIIHCFPGDKIAAKRFLDLGCYISFAGNLTYKKAVNLHEAASYVPLDRLLLETDAPFLTPVPLRGKKNRSEYIIHTYEFISQLRNETVTAIAESIDENFTAILNAKL